MSELTEKALENIEKLAVAATSKTVQMPDGTTQTVIIVPSGFDAKHIKDDFESGRAVRPRRIQQNVAVHTAESFCDYFTLFSDPNSRIFADEKQRVVTAILDYHAAGSEMAPRWGDHRVSFSLERTPEWTTWSSKNRHIFKQVEFAEFLEENVADIQHPPSATMIEIARDMRASIDAAFESAVKAENGSVNLSYNEQITGKFGKQNLSVPERFAIKLSLHVGCEPEVIHCWLRYRIVQGKLSFFYDIPRIIDIERKAFLTARRKIADKLQVGIIDGNVPAAPSRAVS